MARKSSERPVSPLTAAPESESDTSERTVLRSLLLAGSRLGARLFRNQIGRYRLARPSCMECQHYGRLISSGLCVGSSDLVGWVPVTIGPEHLGRTLAVFVSVEAKTAEGRLRPEQKAWLDAVARAGGLATVARSVADLERLLVGRWVK